MHPGSLPARAAREGMTPAAFAEKNKGADTEVGRLARMYFCMQAHISGESPTDEGGDKRSKKNPLYQVG